MCRVSRLSPVSSSNTPVHGSLPASFDWMFHHLIDAGQKQIQIQTQIHKYKYKDCVCTVCTVHLDWMFHELIDGVHGLPHPNICLHTHSGRGRCKKASVKGFEAASNTCFCWVFKHLAGSAFQLLGRLSSLTSKHT